MNDFNVDRRIQNIDDLVSHGNVLGRKAVLEILETGLQAVDPYNNTRKLIRLQDDRLIVGGKEFEPSGSPKTGEEVYELSQIGRIFVFGAGKGIQRVAKAIEDTLGDRLTGGHVIDKTDSPVILKRIGVSLGAHPLPDEGCVRGCEKIRELTDNLTENDLVFTCVGNGIRSLLTMPVPSVSLEDVRKTIMQVGHAAPAASIRTCLDMMKGGKISKLIQPAKAIHIIAIEPGSYDRLMHHNVWLHTLPDEHTTFQLTIDSLKKSGTWDAVPSSVRKFLETADPKYETVKAEEFDKMSFRIFGVMPGRTFGMMPQHGQTTKLPAIMKKARELGFKPIILSEKVSTTGVEEGGLTGEPGPIGKYIAAITRTIERSGQPFEPPCAFFSTGKMRVTVGKEKGGIGGRNQEFVLSAAPGIAGSKNIVIASVDTDGTDGPGTQLTDGPEGMSPYFAGGIIDGETVEEAEKAGLDIVEALKRHNTSPALWKLKDGIVASPNISLGDLTVILVMGYSR